MELNTTNRRERMSGDSDQRPENAEKEDVEVHRAPQKAGGMLSRDGHDDSPSYVIPLARAS